MELDEPNPAGPVVRDVPGDEARDPGLARARRTRDHHLPTPEDDRVGQLSQAVGIPARLLLQGFERQRAGSVCHAGDDPLELLILLRRQREVRPLREDKVRHLGQRGVRLSLGAGQARVDDFGDLESDPAARSDEWRRVAPERLVGVGVFHFRGFAGDLGDRCDPSVRSGLPEVDPVPDVDFALVSPNEPEELGERLERSDQIVLVRALLEDPRPT